MIEIGEILQDSLLSQVHNGGNKWIEKKREVDPKMLKASNGQKWWMAVIVGFIFFIIASPSFFKITNKLFRLICFPYTYYHGSATLIGLFLHMFIFILVIRFILY